MSGEMSANLFPIFCNYPPYYHSRFHQLPWYFDRWFLFLKMVPYLSLILVWSISFLKFLNIWDDISISWWCIYEIFASVGHICKCKETILTFHHSLNSLYVKQKNLEPQLSTNRLFRKYFYCLLCPRQLLVLIVFPPWTAINFESFFNPERLLGHGRLLTLIQPGSPACEPWR